jgi:glycosyltransferase involved in cell wall biosynthesis
MLSASAAAARERGYETTICFSEVARHRPWLAELDVANIRFIERSGIRGAMRQLSRVLSEGDGSPVVLHTHFGTFDEAAALLGMRRRHTAMLSHMHSGNPRPVRLRSKAYGVVFGHMVDGVICVSRETYDQARARAFPASKLIVLPNAVDPDRFPPITPNERAAARRRLQVGPESEIVLHFAWNWEIKGGDRLLAVADAMAARTNTTFFTVVSEHGAGVPTAELERRPNVRALAPRDNINELYAAADAFLNCSRAEGGLPYAVIEALARGLPAVVTDPPVRPELVEGLPGGRAVDPQTPAIAGALGEVLGLTQAERSHHAAAARARVLESYALAPWASRLVSVYDGVLGR